MFAEQIIAEIETLVTGLTTTGSNVQRGQVHPHELAALPALAVFMGADQVVAEYQTNAFDWELSVFIETAVELADPYTTLDSGIDTQLNTIRKEVHAAIMADHTLGLSSVVNVTPVVASQPTLSGEGQRPLASQMLEYVVKYRSSRTALDA